MSETAATAAPAEDLHPVVRTGHAGNRGLWLFAGILALGGLLLFNALNMRRQELASADGRPVVSTGGTIAAPPPLALPPGYADAALGPWPVFRRTRPAAAAAIAPASAPQVVTRVVERVVPTPAPDLPPPPQPMFAPRPSVVMADEARPAATAPAFAEAKIDRVQAGRLLNPSLTVPKGTVVPAVLETALDSTRPGAARAIVSRDVMGFDGTRVLIPRGSRLYGEYQADLQAGQKRALVRWQRLIRPDGVLIELDSPSADPLGRAGIGGKVDSHFLARFGNALLQSVLDIGVGVATREATDGVIVALPGSTQNVSGAANATQIQPTLKVSQGASVSVFVARDLDFSTVDR